jgi:DNA-binding IclR family transcriptional regulator
MKEWSFLTNHATVLSQIGRQPGSSARQIASATDITERALRRVIADLDKSGYISKKKGNSEFRYSINPDLAFRQDLELDNCFRDFVEAMGWESERN